MKTQFTLISIFFSCFMVGCQSTPKAPQLAPSLVPNATTAQSNRHSFKISGKIGVRTAQQNGSAFYGWTQQGDEFAIDLTGALGIGQTSIRGNAEQVTLTSSKTGTLEAATPEELLFQATKWRAPITYLISWINGQPVKEDSMIQRDPLNRVVSIDEGGWHANLNYEGVEKLPNKLVLVENNHDNRVTLTIQSRE